MGFCTASTIYLSYMQSKLRCELGGEQDGGTEVPGLPVPEKYFRNYQSVPQAGLDGRSSPVYSPTVVGGGTVVNGMFFNRGSAGDYDAWEALGNPGWSWAGLLPYFKKVSRFPQYGPQLRHRHPCLHSRARHSHRHPKNC